MGISLKNKKEWENKICYNKNKEEFKIIEYIDTNNVLIKFINTSFEKLVSLSNIKTGCISDPMSPSVYGIGYLGNGNYMTKKNSEQVFYYKR